MDTSVSVEDYKDTMSGDNRKKVVILGGGYAGASVAKALDKTVDVTLVSPIEGYAFHKIGGLRAAIKGGKW